MSDKWLMKGYTKHLRSRMILISTPQKSMVDPGEEKLSLIGKITSWVVTVPASKPRCFWVSILGGLFVSYFKNTDEENLEECRFFVSRSSQHFTIQALLAED